jgi:hypothetical protein
MRHIIGTSLDPVFSRAMALASGLTRSEIAWALKTGELLALRRGAYCRRETYDESDSKGRHLLHCLAASIVHDERHVLSHLSAAISWGLPVPLEGPGRPTLTLPGAPSSTDRQEDLVVQVAELRPRDISPWLGHRRTSIARTVADCLRHLPAPDAVAIADAALHRSRTSMTALRSTLDWQSGWPYAERGRAALAMVDGRRESPLESWSFVVLHLHGIPLPRAQVRVIDQRGKEVARCDGWWPEHGTVCEADGRDKYSLGDWPDLAGAEVSELFDARISAARRALIDEKVREDRVRALGLEMVRWGTYDVKRHPTHVVHDIHGAWRRGDPGRVTARMIQIPEPGFEPLAVGYM